MKGELSEEDKALVKHIFNAYELIKVQPGQKGTIVCPACKGELEWRRASGNGHVWAKCKTENCLSWME